MPSSMTQGLTQGLVLLMLALFYLFAAASSTTTRSIGVGIGIALILFSIISIWFYRQLQKKMNFMKNGGRFLKEKISSNGGKVEMSKIFLIEELKRATDDFNPSRIIGKGDFGAVYKGMLPDGGIVAIKKSKLVNETQVDQFINELVIISQINHRHIVKFLGCCLEAKVALLVYEFVSNGTLSDHIHGDKGCESLIVSWEDRLRIAIEIANALAYLHSEANVQFFHRDIKSTNILLDENFKVKVADFGLSGTIPLDETHLITLVRGTFGYLDPEYISSCIYTDKSDVYSFGVVLVELFTGEKAISPDKSDLLMNLAYHFLALAKENRLLELIDARVFTAVNKEQVLAVANLARRCLKATGNERPAMKEVAESLDGLRRFQEHPMVDQTGYELLFKQQIRASGV